MSEDTPNKNGEVTCPRCGHEFDKNSTTTNSEIRWKWTGTILAFGVVLSLPALVLLAGFSVVTLGPISQGWWVLYTTVVLMAATWTFGKEMLQAVREARGK